ncbi:mechanosensitive ion channel family protein [Flaviaesturariibacter amylovorans]|uniref:Mechanosensitive ion channel family protein n=1 Tax=Flaviaesturariibacter amylovorans TaxID=1084520 RepID=A0ABP8GAY7_9BACT
MPDFLDHVIGNNTVGAYGTALLIIAFVFFLRRPLSRWTASLMYSFFHRIWKNFDKKTFVDLVIHPLGIFLVITVSIITLYRLHFPADVNITLYKYSLQKILLAVGIMLQLGAFTWLILRIIDFIAILLQQHGDGQPAPSEYQLIVFFRDFLKVLVGIVGLLLILRFAFSYNITTLLTGLSIVGAAVALALRESLENLIASFVIFFDKPFTIGDFVKVQSVSGNIERIGLRSTRIRTTDKSYVTVPNKQMVDSILDNVSRRSQIRGTLDLHLHVQSTPAQLEALLTATKGFLTDTKDIHTHSIALSDIRTNAYLIAIEYFTAPIEWPRFMSIKQELNFFVLRKMEELDLKPAGEK